MQARDTANAFRFTGDDRGHYESYFQRANHPTRPLAFWIRYTIFSPRARTDATVGELWAVYFDGELGQISAAKQVVPWQLCQFSHSGLAARVGDSSLSPEALSGSVQGSNHQLSWQLDYTSPQRPLLLLPERLYSAGFPKAKALVGSPQARFRGRLQVDARTIEVDDWVGSQNHNWGERHTDRYAWGQVAGFDGAPEVFLECATASVRLGPFYTPPMSPVVLRLGEEELRFSGVRRALRAKARYAPFSWQIRTSNEDSELQLELSADAQKFVALPYDNPPGGQKICLNSKLAACRLRLSRKGRAPLELSTRRRAAFEILTDRSVPGVVTM
ncbi:MAG: hypothetical protein QM778_10820 [Myxococcales bacterium]